MAKVHLTTKDKSVRPSKTIPVDRSRVEKETFFKNFPDTTDKVWDWFKDQAKDFKEAFVRWYKTNQDKTHYDWLKLRYEWEQKIIQKRGGRASMVAETPDGCIIQAPPPEEAAQINENYGLRHV